MVTDEEGVGCTADLFGIHSPFWTFGIAVSQLLAIDLSKIVNISTAIVCRRATFTDTTQSFLNWSRAFGEDCSVEFVNACRMGFLEYMKSSNFLAASSRVTYVYYLRLDTMMSELKYVLPPHMNLVINSPASKTLCITNGDDSSL